VERRRTTVRDVRRANRASLLTDLFHGGRQSRQQLGDTTALSQASVSNLVGEMIEEGLVEEAGLVGSDGGRPRALLRVAPGFGYVVGADVGETRVLVELYDLAMSRLGVVSYPLGDAADHEGAATLLLQGLAAVTAEAGVDAGQVLGYGVGVPGVVDRGGVVYSQTTGWDGVPMAESLGAAAGVPVFVVNGAQTVGQAEMWFGAGRGARHAVVVLIGRGVGAAVMNGGDGSAVEWGHTPLVYDGAPCRCGARGCLEAYIGGDAINARLGVDDEPRAMSRVLIGPVDSAAVAETVGYLGAGIAGLVNLFGPDRIVLGGPVGAALGERFLPDIRHATARYALRHPFSRTRIDVCQLGPDAVAMGAATVPIANLLANGGITAAAART
jgi:predicted NBD/HSP70 family sugar kinase